MTIQVDTREHKSEWERIRKQFDKEGVEYFRKKLSVGDYIDVSHPAVSVDRKKDLLELCMNVTQDHDRFRRELLRAEQEGTQLIILVEHGKGITCLEDVYFWHNPRLDEMELAMIDGHPAKVQKHPKATDGPQLYRCLLTISKRYHIRFEFCDKKHTGKKIVELLTWEVEAG